MTNVGKTSSDPASVASNLLRQSEASVGDKARTRQQTPADNIMRLTRFSDDGLFDLSLKSDSDQAKFMKSYNAAIQGKSGNGDESGEQAKEVVVEQRVIGFAERLNWTGLPVTAAVEAASKASPDLEALVDSVTKMIAKAIAADAAPVAGKPTQLRLAFAEGNLGLSHLQVVMTGSTLDVILERPKGMASSDELAAAATLLADRLLTRFSKRTVRIIEQINDDPANPQVEASEALDPQKPLSSS